ncbi:thermonuclease family protein [Bacillus sp. EB600]|uniref:thermonuclease family protein n=1 Tax=Bacillus sp. EB600 TaxID=2806345 RepID=UPI00210D45B6|nr:thermonuclease family protein [Bacillus sp. EB600]
MKILRIILLIFALLLLLSALTITGWAWIGLILFLFGLYQNSQLKKGKAKVLGRSILSNPKLYIIGGLLFSFVMAMIFVEPSNDTAKNVSPNQKVKSEQIKKDEKKALDEKKAKEEDEKEAFAKQQAEEQAKQEEEAKQAQSAEQAKQEAARKEQQTAESLGLVAATISRVVDGDTIELTDGRKVRFIGVNTPESTTRHETYGKEASNYTTSKLTGKQVWLQKDVSETDRYGRLLRIVWLAVPSNDMDENEIKTKMYNADLVLNGFAEPSTYPPDVKYSDYFVKYAREARDKGTGLWAYGVNGTTKGDLDQSTAVSSSQSSSSNTTNSSAPAASTPAATTPAPASGESEYFANCTELRKKYPNGVPSTHPAYQAKMDRDHDNYACEQ